LGFLVVIHAEKKKVLSFLVVLQCRINHVMTSRAADRQNEFVNLQTGDAAVFGINAA
jgi:hypothetical protein